MAAANDWKILAPLAALALMLMLTAPPAYAQADAKPIVPNQPSAPTAGSDTARLVTQHTPSGVRYVVREPGAGPLAKPNSRVSVRYVGFLPDGHVFDATAAWGGPLRFRVGRHEIIRGLEEVLLLLPAGARARAWIPAELAYGAKGVRNADDDTRFLIPPDTELVFELQVMSVR